ncbi:MAG: hypothetical protein M3R15_08670 [Acidobacteriota bacterium]|nr:hypothetical protein [Acidobacteriota bacterium]
MAHIELAQAIETLLRETGHLHHRAFIDTDGADPDWPIWYAEHIKEKLAGLLRANFTKSELVFLLVMAEKEQALRAPGADWAKYYARFFMERYGEGEFVSS